MAANRKNFQKRKPVRRTASFVAAILFGLVFLGPAGEFFIELARSWGWYDDPEESLRSAMATFSALVTSTWFLCLTAFAIGLALGTWVDLLLARQERRDFVAVDQSRISSSGLPSFSMKAVKLDPAIQSLLDNIAWLHKALEDAQAESQDENWDSIIDPISHGPSEREARGLLVELESIETQLFYNKPLQTALGRLIELYRQAIHLIGNMEKVREFEKLMRNAENKALRLAEQVGAPVTHHLGEASDNQSRLGTEPETQP